MRTHQEQYSHATTCKIYSPQATSGGMKGNKTQYTHNVFTAAEDIVKK